MRNLVCGVGVNDSETAITYYDKQGKQTGVCPFYSTWSSMLKRCYSVAYQSSQPTYKGCTVVKEWHTFSMFKGWMESQDWVGKVLDKDLIVEDNKVYSPQTCCFISPEVNEVFRKYRRTIKTGLPVGVRASGSRYKTGVQVKSTRLYLGVHDTIHAADEAVKRAKDDLIKEFALLEEDSRIRSALVNRLHNNAEIA
ncbi:hypothetical protein N9937_01920 [bacterium]|nr:hypothetical protein [bacterium]